ncbi:MAG: hypothetical protein IJE68_05040 [Clostridia bacterium]|nr:hypothetical protein [Clostridia bacterium]
MGAGILSIIIGIFFLIIRYKRVPNMKKCKGIIVSTEAVDIPGERDKRYGHAQYFIDGNEYYIKTTYASNDIYKGKSVVIKYNSRKPEEAIVAYDKCSYIGPLVFIIFGVYAILSTLGIIPAILG